MTVSCALCGHDFDHVTVGRAPALCRFCMVFCTGKAAQENRTKWAAAHPELREASLAVRAFVEEHRCCQLREAKRRRDREYRRRKRAKTQAEINAAGIAECREALARARRPRAA